MHCSPSYFFLKLHSFQAYITIVLIFNFLEIIKEEHNFR